MSLTIITLVANQITFSRVVLESPSNVPQVVFRSLPFVASLAWAVFVATLVWKGKVRRIWRKKGHDYDIFRLLVRMRGSNARIMILKSLSTEPKNKLQLAREIGMDWQSINDHMNTLLNYSLVKEVGTSGRAKYFSITDKGTELLQLINDGFADASGAKTAEADNDRPEET